MADPSVSPAPADGAPSAELQEKQVEEAPGIKIFAGNLDYSITDDDLKTFFAPIESDILSCQVILRGTRSAGYGFVAVATDEAAQKAIDALNGQDLQGRKAIVELAKPAEEKEKERKAKRRTSRRGTKAVPGEVTEAEANGEAEKPATANEEGEANKPKKKKKKSVRKLKSKVKDAVTPAENGAPAEATAEGEKKSPRPKRASKPRRPAGEEPTGEQSKSTLFVANLPFSLDDAELGAIFTEAGFTVSSARVVRRRWGHPRKSKGYGFVDVGDEEAQAKAIEALQGKELNGRQLAVKVAVNPTAEDDSEDGAEDAEGKKTEVSAAPVEEAVAVA